MIPEKNPEHIRALLDAVYRSESQRILATLIRILGDFDAAEEALQEAFRIALEQWPHAGIPNNPRAWLISAAKFRAIDSLRRQSRFQVLDEDDEHSEATSVPPPEAEADTVEDDQLRLIFTCCHPALVPEARLALTLREVCGLTTEEIARAFLMSPATLAQRIVRAKAKIREARIPYQVPSSSELPDRLDAVLQVIYLLFNEGYSASSGESLTRPDLSGEAIRVGRLLVDLLPDPEAIGLLALMLLQDSRRDARTSPAGDLVLLDEQDRTLWNRDEITEGLGLVQRAFDSHRVGPYTLQAAIAAVHADAPEARNTDWSRIISLYDLLQLLAPSPVVALNRAVAVAMRDGPEAGVDIIESLLKRGELREYRFAHSALGELYRSLGKMEEARNSYATALTLTTQETERRFLQRKLQESG
jgi:RNA polymerase sigma-70 factor, ECF subfamily